MHATESPVPAVSQQESPVYVRLSLAAAMTLGFTQGCFFRNARLGCINLLLTYSGGCRANCAFCGLASEKWAGTRPRSFIRVPWRTYHTEAVIDAVRSAPAHVHRVCISMVTHPKCREDVINLCGQISKRTTMDISLLVSPSVLHPGDLKRMKAAGAECIGVAIDAATPLLFEQLRGRTVHGPHSWDRYWNCYAESLDVFGKGMAGVHLICGLGETEKEMVMAMYQARSMGGFTHLFSFFPEKHSAMENVSPPALSHYRRIQLARWAIDQDLTHPEAMQFDNRERIRDFGISETSLHKIVWSGEPFRTSGCPGKDGAVACNRPYGNEKPGENIRNFPFQPEKNDLEKVWQDLFDYSGPDHDRKGGNGK